MRELKFLAAFVLAAIGTCYMALPWCFSHFSITESFLVNTTTISPWFTGVMFLSMCGGWMYMGVHSVEMDRHFESPPDPKSRKPLPKVVPHKKLTLVSSNNDIKRAA